MYRLHGKLIAVIAKNIWFNSYVKLVPYIECFLLIPYLDL